MARMARFKISEEESWYHIHSRISGSRGEYPLAKPLAQRTLMETIKHYSKAYFCEIASVTIMGNHYHLICRFDCPKEVDFDDLKRRAMILYPSDESQKAIELWPQEKWDRLQERLFDVSEFMRNIQSAYARWYNHTYERRGRFWADRFKSVYLADLNAVLDCMLYVDLNPVRAGLVERPEEWKGSSLYLREIGKADWFMPFGRVCPGLSAKKALIEYRERLYFRGSIPTKPGQKAISEAVLGKERARGFKVSGVYLRRLGYFADGIAIGTEGFIRDQLSKLRDNGCYLRRKHPIRQLEGIHLSLREQRSTAVQF